MIFKISLIIIVFCIFIINILCLQETANAIDRSRILIEKYQIEAGIPGVVVGISLNANIVWTEGFGYSDIENNVKCDEHTVMRIASITKSIGTALVSKMVEQKVLEWDTDINHYVSENLFPKKSWKGETVKITLRQLVSHVSGIRTTENQDFTRVYNFNNVSETLVMFANDSLVAKPDTIFYYSNFGWQLIGAAVESVTGQSYEKLINNMFQQFNMSSTRMESRYALIPHRSRHYAARDATINFQLRNTPLIDWLRPFPNWPCGGVVSTASDLLTFANVMLDSYAGKGYLNRETVQELWRARNFTLELEWYRSEMVGVYEALTSYGMGWDVTVFNTTSNSLLSGLQFIHHSGELEGSTTLLGLFPELNASVAIIANIGGLSELPSIAVNIMQNFLS